VTVLQRDDPLRRSYLQWRWHGGPPLLRRWGATVLNARPCLQLRSAAD